MNWPIIDALAPFFFKNYQGCIVEIGAGKSTMVLNRLAVGFKRRFYSCDVVDKFKENLSKYHIRVIKKSFEFMKDFNDTPMFVLLDGSHDYEVVKKEFYFFYERLTSGGVIFMHDMIPPSELFLDKSRCGDAYKLRLEIEKDPNIDIVSFQFPMTIVGQSMVIKRNRKNNYSPPGEIYNERREI